MSSNPAKIAKAQSVLPSKSILLWKETGFTGGLYVRALTLLLYLKVRSTFTIFFLGYLIYQWFSIIKKPQQLAKIDVSHCILPRKCVPTIYKTELKLQHLTLHIFNLLKNYSLHLVFLISYLFKLTFLIKDKFKVEI